MPLLRRSSLLLLTALALVPLSCSDLSVDPVEEDLAPLPESSPTEATTALPFSTGLNETQQQVLFRVLGGVTEPDHLDPAQRASMVQALTEARAQAVALHEEQVLALRSSDLAPHEHAERAQADAAFRDFTLSFLDKAVAALTGGAAVAAVPPAGQAAETVAPARSVSAPTIFCVQPPDGRIGELVLIFGTNFDLGAVPFFGSVPSIPLFTFASPRAVPGFGRLSVLVAPVPPNLFQGNTPLRIQYQGQSSSPTPFRVRLFGGTYQQGPDPELWCAEPREGGFLQPVVLLGFDFTEDSAPFFGPVPALNLGTFTLPIEIPFFGTFSAMLTLVPSFVPGPAAVTVRRDGGRTERVPFQITR